MRVNQDWRGLPKTFPILISEKLNSLKPSRDVCEAFFRIRTQSE